MEKLKEYIKRSAREAWDDFWQPFYWLISSKRTAKGQYEVEGGTTKRQKEVTKVISSLLTNMWTP
ncbi:hypothetical protein ACO0KY_17745 [Undibacterium sp. Dicai25W]|uniref:hypothetical protein n=1 Tax=Undibacterium sp. Dicai25W TaxID=3413034 RepID=UPI003BEF88B0